MPPPSGMLNGSTVLHLLGEKPGRYVFWTMEQHSMKEANGEEVQVPVLLLTVGRIEELVDANQLVRQGTDKYVLAKSPSHLRGR
jgi:hypothetical protein